MKNSSRLIPALGFLLLLGSCASHDTTSSLQEGSKKLSARQVRELMNGSTVRLDGYGQEATVEFTGDGVMNGTNSTGDKDKGDWQVRGDALLCLRFKDWVQGDRFCYLVAGSGKDYQLFNRKGMKIYAMTVLTPGEQGSTTGSPAVRTPAPRPSRPALESAPQPEVMPLPVSPHAAEDVDFLIRQSAQNCPGCNLARVNLSGMSLIGANLQGANLTEADLSRANLRRANLRGANLYRANLRQADLTGADLTGANLSEALRE